MAEYEPMVVNSRERYLEYEALRVRELALRERATDPKEQFRHGWSAYMCLRLMGDLRNIADLQARNEHQVVMIVNEHLVCACGLISPEVGDDTDHGSVDWFMVIDGHLDH